LYAAPLNADNDEAVGAAVRFDDLVGHAAERPLDRVCIENGFSSISHD
jgi:hypothetical protein